MVYNTHKKGYYRDRSIINAIKHHKVLDTEQIRLLLFSKQKSGLRIAQRRLKKLVDTKKINRARDSIDCQYEYFIGKRPSQNEHILMVNWVYIWILYNLRSWEKLERFDFEQDYGILRSDAFVFIKNKFTDKNKFLFIEVDMSDNPFDKVEKYNRLYEEERYSGWWWVKLTDRFPKILIFTNRKLEIVGNKNNLEFEIHDLESIKEVY